MKRIINILLVGNDAADRDILQESLDKRGILYHLVCSCNATETFDVLESLYIWPDVALIDIDLKEINGFELAVRIRSNPKYDKMHLFLIGSVDDESDRRTAEKIGASGFIAKPTRLESMGTIDEFNLMMDLMNSRPIH
jgi:CheY-like chemotaxis protein